MSPGDVQSWLDQGALLVMAGGFLWLVKAIVQDHSRELKNISSTLIRIEAALKGER